MSTSKAAATRERIIAHVQAYPGLHLRALERELGLSSALVHYHVKELIKADEIAGVTYGGFLRLFPTHPGGRGFTEADGEFIAAMREEVPFHIVLLLLERRSIPQSELVDELGLAKSTVSYHIEKLAQRGIVDRADDGRERTLRLADVRRVKRLLRSYSPTDALLDRFRDLWGSFYD